MRTEFTFLVELLLYNTRSFGLIIWHHILSNSQRSENNVSVCQRGNRFGNNTAL